MDRPHLVLFVCTGNQCRSPAAEYILNHLAAQAGLDVRAISAGTSAWDGIPAHDVTSEAAHAAGYDLGAHRSQALTRDLVDYADVVLVMARRHQDWMRRTMPHASHKVHLFKPYCLGRGEELDDEIADPVSGPLEVHRECVDEIASLLGHLVSRWGRVD